MNHKSGLTKLKPFSSQHPLCLLLIAYLHQPLLVLKKLHFQTKLGTWGSSLARTSQWNNTQSKSVTPLSGGDSGDYFLMHKDLEETFIEPFPNLHHAPTPLFTTGITVHSGTASLHNCEQAFPHELHANFFSNGFTHYAWTAQTANFNLIGSWVYVCLVVTCHLHFWQNVQGLFPASGVTQGFIVGSLGWG